jgi:uncharacterized protein YndB with AHSA1/START domain
VNSDHTLPVRITSNFAATPEATFDAWLNPDIMRQWLFASPTNQILQVKTDPRVGGSFSILERNAGEEIDHFGEYLEIERPRRLRFTLEVPWHFPGVTRVSIDIAPTASGCVMEFIQTGVKRDVTEGSWREMFTTLAAVLGRTK